MRDREAEILELREYFECICDAVEKYYDCTKDCYDDCGCDVSFSDFEHTPGCAYLELYPELEDSEICKQQ